MNLFNLFATLKLDSSSFDKGIASAKAKMQSIGSSFSGFGDAIGGIGASLKAVGQNLTSFGNKVTSIGRTASVVTAGVGAVLAGAFVKAKDYIGTYESAMATFRHSAQIGEEGAQALYDSLLKVAKNSAYAQEHFLSAGQSLVAMGLSASDTTKYIQAITDVTAKMGGSGQQIEEMADLFGKLSLQTNLYTQDINQMVTAGIPAWDILATHYHTTTDEVKKMAREGLLPAKESLDIITGALEETNEASEMFKFSAAGMAAELKSGTLTGALDSLNTSFRTFALNLLDLDPRTESGKENIKTLNATIAKFGETMENVGSRFSFVGDWIKIGLENITKFLENLNRTIENMPQEQLESLVRIIGTIAVAGPALIIVGKAISTIGTAISGFGSLFSGIGWIFKAGEGGMVATLTSIGAKLAALAPVLGAIAAVVGVVSLAFVFLREHWDAVVAAWNSWIENSGLKDTLESIKEKFSALGEKLGGLHDLFQVIGAVCSAVVVPIFMSLMALFNALMGALDGIMTTIGGVIDFLSGIGQLIVGIFTGDGEKINEALNKIISGLSQMIFGFGETIFGFLGGLLGGILGWFGDVGGSIVSWLGDVFNNIASWFGNLLGSVGTWLVNIFNSFISWSGNLLNSFGSWLSNMWNSLVSWFSNVWNKITQWGSDVLNSVKEKWEAIKQSITQAITNAYNAVSSWINRIKDSVSNVFNNIKSIVTNIWNSIASKASEIWGNITGTIKGAMDKARDIVRNIIDTIKGFFNFQFHWPRIPLPHFRIDPSGWQIGDLFKGSIPSLSIDWYAKGGVFTKPTIFPTLNGLAGVGEAGAEAVLPIKTLKGYIVEAMAEGVKEAQVAYKDSASAKANTGLVNGLISALQSGEKGSINVYIGGKLIANEVYEPLMNIMKNKEVVVGA